MQTLSRTLLSLRGACSTTSAFATRAFSEAASAGSGSGAARTSARAGLPSTPAEQQGAKSKLFQILSAAEEPLTAEQIWQRAEQEGLRSKRFTKMMLQQMKQGGWVKTQPLGGGKKHRNFGYKLLLARQLEHTPKLECQAAAGTAG